jgi:hypothetical protein
MQHRVPKRPPGCPLFSIVRKERLVPRFNHLFAGFLTAWLIGCNNAPGPIETIARDTAAESAAPESAPPQHEPPMEDDQADMAVGEIEPAKDDRPRENAEDTGPRELSLDQSGISFVVPAGWKRVKPQTNIIEAEFELPRVEGDEYDGRLTLMSSLGNPQEVIATRTAEFRQEPGEAAPTEKLSIGSFEASLIDLRGEWKGPSFRPVPPRADYRMLLVIVPFSERSAFYAKLTGPRSTIAAHEEAFREFLRAAKISR